MNAPDLRRVAVVTGVSSGIGETTAAVLVEHGFRVFGSVRRPDSPVPAGVEALSIDVRKPETIEAAITHVLKEAGRIDVLVNNAGSTIIGAIEETDTEQAQVLFDTNFFGAVRMTKAVLPTMREQGAGRIIFVSSLVGLLPAPFMGFYAASKHAIEGYAESLDHEVRSLAIRAVLIEPGFVRTRIDQNTVYGAAKIDTYEAARSRVAQQINTNVENGEDPAVVARTVLAAIEARRPRQRYPVGKGAAMLSTLRRLLPAGMFGRSLRKQFRVDA